MLSDIYYPDILPKVCMLSLSMDIVEVQVTDTFTVLCSFLVPIFTTAINHILFFHRMYMTAYLILMTLSNSHSSIQDAPASLPLLRILQWNLRQVSLRQQHCRTSVLLQHYIQPLSSPALISARG